MRNVWIAVKVNRIMFYWYPFGDCWGYQGAAVGYAGLMIGRGHPHV